MKEYTILLVDSSESNRQILLNAALKMFGGYTLGQKAQGAWLDEKTGAVHYDDSTPLCIATDDEELLVNFANFVKGFLNQLAVYVRFPDGTVRFI